MCEYYVAQRHGEECFEGEGNANTLIMIIIAIIMIIIIKIIIIIMMMIMMMMMMKIIIIIIIIMIMSFYIMRLSRLAVLERTIYFLSIQPFTQAHSLHTHSESTQYLLHLTTHM